MGRDLGSQRYTRQFAQGITHVEEKQKKVEVELKQWRGELCEGSEGNGNS